MIRRDIARTYPEHDFFKEKDGLGQESLFNVMKAYSLHDREVGYCQGSAFIVGILLMQVIHLIIDHMADTSPSSFSSCLYLTKNVYSEKKIGKQRGCLVVAASLISYCYFILLKDA